MRDADPTIGRRTATDKREHFRMAIGSFTRSGKFAGITDPVERMATKALHAAAIDWCREHGTDGYVILEDLCDYVGLPYEYGKNLIVYGTAHEAEHGCRRCPPPRDGHVYMHDYLEHNHSAAEQQRISKKRQAAGMAAAEKRWGGHTPPVKEKRPPGRPRKHPLPEVVEVPAGLMRPGESMLLPDDDALIPTEQVLAHPAETRARQQTKRGPGRPRKTEPRTFDEWIVTAANRLADLIANNDPNGKRPNVTQTWMNTIRLIHEVDDREIDRIQNAIEWSQQHHFYSTIILSPQNLRKHFGAMHKRAIEEHNRKVNGGRSPQRSAPAALPKDNSMFDDDYMPGARR